MYKYKTISGDQYKVEVTSAHYFNSSWAIFGSWTIGNTMFVTLIKHDVAFSGGVGHD